jgi:hypothetical protein
MAESASSLCNSSYLMVLELRHYERNLPKPKQKLPILVGIVNDEYDIVGGIFELSVVLLLLMEPASQLLSLLKFFIAESSIFTKHCDFSLQNRVYSQNATATKYCKTCNDFHPSRSRPDKRFLSWYETMTGATE